MNIQEQQQAFLQYHINHGGQTHYMVWSQSQESPYGVFSVDWEKLSQDGSPLSSSEAEAVSIGLTASWHTWMYCRMNPVAPEGMVLLTKEKVNEVIVKLKEVIAARDDLMKIVEQMPKQAQ